MRENDNTVVERKEREFEMSSYEQKLESARTIFEEHNKHIEDESKQLNFDNFLSNLKAAGGTSDEALAECSFEDIAEFGGRTPGGGSPSQAAHFPRFPTHRAALLPYSFLQNTEHSLRQLNFKSSMKFYIKYLLS